MHEQWAGVGKGKGVGGTRSRAPSGPCGAGRRAGKMRRDGRRGWATTKAKLGRKEEKGVGLDPEVGLKRKKGRIFKIKFFSKSIFFNSKPNSNGI